MLPTGILSIHSAQTMYEGRINAFSICFYPHNMEADPLLYLLLLQPMVSCWWTESTVPSDRWPQGAKTTKIWEMVRKRKWGRGVVASKLDWHQSVVQFYVSMDGVWRSVFLLPLCYLLRLASAPVYQCLHADLPLPFLSFSTFSSCTARSQFLLYLFPLSLFLSFYPSVLSLNTHLSVCELLISLHFFSPPSPSMPQWQLNQAQRAQWQTASMGLHWELESVYLFKMDGHWGWWQGRC